MHLQRLTATNVAIPNNITGMLILVALPAKWDHIAAIYLQGKMAIGQVLSTEVQQAIVAKFDQTNSRDWQQAHRIGAIKRKGEHPCYFKQGSADKPSKAKGNHSGNSEKKTRCGGKRNKGKGRAAVAVLKPNPFTLATSATLAPAQPVIAIQPSMAPPSVKLKMIIDYSQSLSAVTNVI